MKPLISFVVPAYNSHATIGKCLQSLAAHARGNEIIVVDNNSSDGTLEVAKKFRGVRVFVEKKRGAAAARNSGLAASSGKYIAFIDSDCILPAGWAKTALHKITGKGIAGVGGPGKSVDSSLVSKSLDAFLYGRGGSAKSVFVDSLATMNVMYRRAALAGLRFDEDFRSASGEDPDLNMKLRRKGHKLLFDESLWVWHHHPVTMKGMLKKWYNYGKNYPKLCSKHSELRTPGYYGRLLFFPVFTASVIAAPFFRPAGAIPLLELAALFLAYTLAGTKHARGTVLFAFPFIHTAKQLAQMLGMFQATLKKE